MINLSRFSECGVFGNKLFVAREHEIRRATVFSVLISDRSHLSRAVYFDSVRIFKRIFRRRAAVGRIINFRTFFGCVKLGDSVLNPTRRIRINVRNAGNRKHLNFADSCVTLRFAVAEGIVGNPYVPRLNGRKVKRDSRIRLVIKNRTYGNRFVCGIFASCSVVVNGYGICKVFGERKLDDEVLSAPIVAKVYENSVNDVFFARVYRDVTYNSLPVNGDRCRRGGRDNPVDKRRFLPVSAVRTARKRRFVSVRVGNPDGVFRKPFKDVRPLRFRHFRRRCDGEPRKKREANRQKCNHNSFHHFSFRLIPRSPL